MRRTSALNRFGGLLAGAAIGWAIASFIDGRFSVWRALVYFGALTLGAVLGSTGGGAQ